MPTRLSSTWKAPAAAASQSPALKPAKMPTPPSIGVGASCQRSALGRATSRRASGDPRRSQIATAEAGSATIATALVTGAQRNGRPLARCEDATPLGRRPARRERELPVAAERTDLPARPHELLRNGCVDAGADDDVAEIVSSCTTKSVERRQEDDAPT